MHELIVLGLLVSLALSVVGKEEPQYGQPISANPSLSLRELPVLPVPVSECSATSFASFPFDDPVAVTHLHRCSIRPGSVAQEVLGSGAYDRKFIHDNDTSIMKTQFPALNVYNAYPLSKSDFQNSLNSTAHGLNDDRLRAALIRAQEPYRKGFNMEPVNIYVFGTSMTVGAGCTTNCKETELRCAWPAMLQHALHAMSWNCNDNDNTVLTNHSTKSIGNDKTVRTRAVRGFRVHNHAEHGRSSGFFATFGLGDLNNADIVLMDNSVNDGNHIKGSKNSLRLYTESLIRTILELPSGPAVIYLATFTGNYFNGGWEKGQPYSERPCSDMRAQDLYYPVTSYYGVPLISYRDVAMRDGGCRIELGGLFSHPHWRIHQFISDIIAHFFSSQTKLALYKENAMQNSSKQGAEKVAMNATEITNLGVTKPVLPPMIYSAQELAGSSLCTIVTTNNNMMEHRPVLSSLEPLRAIQSSGKDVGNGVQIISKNGWSCYDDTKNDSQSNLESIGRPGWIATSKGSILSVGFTTSDSGSVALSYLASYEGFSGVRVTLDGKTDIRPRLIPTARIRLKRNNNEFAIPIVPFSSGDENRNKLSDASVHGILNAQWDEPYSLPQTLTIRRLDPGKHVLELQLLGFNDERLTHKKKEATKPASAPTAFINGRNSTDVDGNNQGKFKVLGLTAC